MRASAGGGRRVRACCASWPGPAALYDLLAKPLMANAAGRLAPDRHQRVLAVPGAAEDHAAAGLPGRAARGAVPGVGLRRAGPVLAREAPGAAAGGLQHAAVLRRRGVLLFHRVRPGCSTFIQLVRAGVGQRRARHRGLPRLRADACSWRSASPSRCRWRWWCWRAWAWSASTSCKSFRGYFIVVASIVVGHRHAARHDLDVVAARCR